MKRKLQQTLDSIIQKRQGAVSDLSTLTSGWPIELILIRSDRWVSMLSTKINAQNSCSEAFIHYDPHH